MASSSSSSSDQAPAAIDPVVWIGEYCLAHELHDVVQLLNQRFVESLVAYTHGPEGIENSPVAPMARRYHLYLVAGLLESGQPIPPESLEFHAGEVAKLQPELQMFGRLLLLRLRLYSCLLGLNSSSRRDEARRDVERFFPATASDAERDLEDSYSSARESLLSLAECIGVRNRAARKAGLLQELEALEAQLGRDAASERHGGTEVTEYPLIEHYASYSRSRERQFPRPFLDQLADEVQHKLYPFSIPSFERQQLSINDLRHAFGAERDEWLSIYRGEDPEVQRFIALSKGSRTPPAAAALRDMSRRLREHSKDPLASAQRKAATIVAQQRQRGQRSNVAELEIIEEPKVAEPRAKALPKATATPLAVQRLRAEAPHTPVGRGGGLSDDEDESSFVQVPIKLSTPAGKPVISPLVREPKDASTSTSSSSSTADVSSWRSRPAKRAAEQQISPDTTKRRKRVPWSDEEVEKLFEGISIFGPGLWKEIRDHCGFPNRTSVDLKDKYRWIQNDPSARAMLDNYLAQHK